MNRPARKRSTRTIGVRMARPWPKVRIACLHSLTEPGAPGTRPCPVCGKTRKIPPTDIPLAA